MLQRCAPKTLQDNSKVVENVHHRRYGATCVLFESFWSQNAGKRSTKTSVGKWLIFYRKSRKCRTFCRLLTFSVKFHLRLETFGIMKASKNSG